MEQVEEPIPEPTYPNPPRWRWTKRLAIGFGSLFLLMVGLVLWWRYEAHRRLLAEIAIAQHAGDSIQLAAPTSAGLAPAQDAYVNLITATVQLNLVPKDLEFALKYKPPAPYRDTDMVILERVAQTAARSLDLAHQARFQGTAESNWNQLPIGTYRSLYRLLIVLRGVMFFQQLSGNDAQSIETARDLFRAVNVISEMPDETAHYLGARYTDECARSIGDLSFNLKMLDNPPAATQPSGPTSRAQVKALIDELLSDQTFIRAFGLAETRKRRETAERFLKFDYKLVSATQIPLPWFLNRPLVDMHAAHLLKEFDDLIEAASAPGYDVTKLTSGNNANTRPRGPVTVFTSLASPSGPFAHYTMYDTHYQALATRRIVALQFAIKLYRLDHAGELPDKLQDLAPNYIPALPADPFAADQSTMRYRKTPVPMIYSVGMNGHDDGGNPATPPPGPWDALDAVFRLPK